MLDSMQVPSMPRRLDGPSIIGKMPAKQTIMTNQRGGKEEQRGNGISMCVYPGPKKGP